MDCYNSHYIILLVVTFVDDAGGIVNVKRMLVLSQPTYN